MQTDLRFAALCHSMRDVVEDRGFDARQLLNKGKNYSLREQMREFISEHSSDAEMKDLRAKVSGGESMSEIVKEDREERV